jgi:hypothetical protein
LALEVQQGHVAQQAQRVILELEVLKAQEVMMVLPVYRVQKVTLVNADHKVSKEFKVHLMVL